MSVVWILLIAVLLPLATGLASLLLPARAVTPRVLLALSGPLVAFLLIAGNLDLHDADAMHVEQVPGYVGGMIGVPAPPAAQPPEIPWIPSLNLNLSWWPNGLGGFFGLLVSGIGVLIVLYARGYFGAADEQARLDLRRFYAALGFFTTAMLGVVLADSTLLTLVFWELTSVSSFLLIGWDRHDRGAMKLAVQAFFTTGLGGMFLLGGIAVFGATTGVWRWSELASADLDFNSTGVLLGFLFMFIGAAAKSAQWPLHYWLPGAMAAPTPVSAFLHSATMVKAGVFLVGRLFPAFGDATDGASLGTWAAWIIPFGTVTMLLGGVMAVCKHDLKQVFAYTTISQLGLLMTMYGLGGLTYAYEGSDSTKVLPAIDFDVTQIANHAFYKAPLFICAGAIGHVASRQLPELFGAFWKHKAICGVLLAAGWCLAALPLSVSFQAKEIFLYATVHAAKEHPLVYGVLVATLLTAMCNVAIFVRLCTTLLGSGRFGLRQAPADRIELADEEHDDHAHHHAARGRALGRDDLAARRAAGGPAVRRRHGHAAVDRPVPAVRDERQLPRLPRRGAVDPAPLDRASALRRRHRRRRRPGALPAAAGGEPRRPHADFPRGLRGALRRRGLRGAVLSRPAPSATTPRSCSRCSSAASCSPTPATAR